MAFWDFQDHRYREARNLLVLSVLGLIAGVGVLVWLYWPGRTNPEGTTAPVVAATPASTSRPTATPAPAPAPTAPTAPRAKPLREEMLQALDAGEFDRAESLARQILEANPQDVDAWNRLGWIYKKRGDLPKALEAYDQTVNLPSEQKDYYLYQRALLHRQMKDYPSALRDMKQSAELNFSSVGVSNMLLILQIEGGEEDQAVRTMNSNAAMNLESQKPAWFLGLAAKLMKDGDFGQARDALATFKQSVPQDVFAELIDDPFFEPYRGQPALQSFFLPDPQASPAPF